MADMEAGLGDVLIMEKHKISPEALLAIRNKLRQSGRLRSQWSPKGRDSSFASLRLTQKRAQPRRHVFYDVTVQDALRPDQRGFVNDITVTGVQVTGLPSRVEESRKLIIRSEMFTHDVPVVFEALCRWAGRLPDSGVPLAGYLITRISDQHTRALRQLIDQATLG
jgi:hypothetical protein